MIDVYQHLSSLNQYAIQVWSPQEPTASYRAHAKIEKISAYSGKFPQGGTFIIGGCTTEIGQWFDHVSFDKIILIHNEYNPGLLYNYMHRLRFIDRSKIEICVVGQFVQKALGIPSKIQPHYPNSQRFSKLLNIDRSFEINHKPSRPFTIGKCSRDVLSKHHFRDPALYKKLRNAGCNIRLLGATCLRPWLDNEAGIELLREQAHSQLAEYLSSVDCFFYRTCISYKEAFGTVVLEAMLAGLPVVCSRQGGYADLINHGKNGFLFDTDEEAYELIMQLKNQPKLAKTISQQARQPIDSKLVHYL